MKSSFKHGMTNNLINKLLKTCFNEVDRMKTAWNKVSFSKNENERVQMNSFLILLNVRHFSHICTNKWDLKNK